MRNNMLNKVLSVIVLTTFMLSDICFGLGVQPGTTQPPTKEEMYALGQKLFAAKNGPGTIDWERGIPQKFTGQAPKIDGVQIVETNHNDPPEEWRNNYLLKETDLIKALKTFALTQAHLRDSDFDIREGYFPVDKSKGELPIARIEKEAGRYTLIVHTEFVQTWNHIRRNDIWFEYKFSDGEVRVVSAAWAIFYRLAKHEMSDLEKMSGLPKSVGHATKYSIIPGDTIMLNETIANDIRGRYNIVNDGIWLWFLSSYSFTNNVRYDNDELARRIAWLFEGDDPDVRRMAREEFPNLAIPRQLIHNMHRDLAISIALFTNYHFFSLARGIPQFTIDPEFIAEYKTRESARKAAGITEQPIYATGSGEEKIEQILAILVGKAGNKDGFPEDRLPTIVALFDYGVITDEYVLFLKLVAENTALKLEERVIAGAALLRHEIDYLKNQEFLYQVSVNNNINLSSRIRACGELLALNLDFHQNSKFLHSIVSNPNISANERMLACAFLSAAGSYMNEYYPFIRQVINGYFADEEARLFARITLLNAGVETQESLAYLHGVIENQSQHARLRYAACDALLKYYAKPAFEKNPESPVSEVAREGIYLQDLAQHRLVNALLGMFIELKASDKAGFWQEQRMDHAKIIWIGEKHKRNSSFKNIFDKLVEVEANNRGRRLPNFNDQMSVADKIVKLAGLKKKIVADRNFLRQLKQGLEEQIEHFSVYKYKSTIYAMRGYTRLAARLKGHVDVERSMHLSAIQHTFGGHHNRFDRYAQYEKWRRFPNGKREVRTGNESVEGWMSYNEFAQLAHNCAELVYPVSGTINHGRMDIQGPEVPVAGIRPRNTNKSEEGPIKPVADIRTEQSLSEVISEHIVRIGLDKGPGSIEPSTAEMASFYPIYEELKKQRVEIFLPQHMHKKLTAPILNEIEALNRRISNRNGEKGEDAIKITPFDSENLRKKLGQKDPDVRRIFANDSGSVKWFMEILNEDTGLLKGNRLYTPEFPQGNEDIDNTFYQAWMVKTSILSALLSEENKTGIVGKALSAELNGRIALGAGVSDMLDISTETFINNLAKEDSDDLVEVRARVNYFLGTVVRVVEFIGEQIRILKAFWIAA